MKRKSFLAAFFVIFIYMMVQVAMIGTQPNPSGFFAPSMVFAGTADLPQDGQKIVPNTRPMVLVNPKTAKEKNYNSPKPSGTTTLTVNKEGVGSGKVTASPGELAWNGRTGTADYESGTVVTLTAAAGAGSTFAGWGGACSGSGSTATVNMDLSKSCTATFNGRRLLVLDNANNEMAGALDKMGYQYTVLDAAGFEAAVLNNYDVIMTAWQLPSSSVNALIKRKTDIANWTRAGGRVFTSSSVNVAYNGNNDWSWVPLSVTPPVGVVDGDDVEVVATNHALMKDPNILTSESMSNWMQAYHNIWESYDPGFELIAKNSSDQALILSASYGEGMIVVSGSDPEYHTLYGPQAAEQYMENLLNWAGESDSGRIVGTVTSSAGGAPVAGVEVAASGPSSATSVTGDDGSYSINYLTPGSYTLTFTKTGYNTATSSGVTVNSGATTTENKAMTPVATCTYTLSPTSANYPAGSNTGRINVTTQSGCTWDATTEDSWISFDYSGAGFASDFKNNAEGWSQQTGNWSVSGGSYNTSGVSGYYATTAYEGSYENFTYRAYVKRVGTRNYVNNILMRGTPAPIGGENNWNNAYDFGYSNAGYFRVVKWVNGSITWLQGWAATTAVVEGEWNEMKVVASGSSLSFYINDTLVWQGTDGSISSGRVGVGLSTNTTDNNQIYVDSAEVTVSASAAQANSTANALSSEQAYLNRNAGKDASRRRHHGYFDGSAAGAEAELKAAGISATSLSRKSTGTYWRKSAANSSASSGGTGNGVINYRVTENTGAERTGTITVTGVNYSIKQAGANVGTPISWGDAKIAALFSDYGSSNGIWSNDGSTWSRLSDWKPAQMIRSAEGGIVVSFNQYGEGGNGIWNYNGSSWNRLTDWFPTNMTAYGDNKLAGKFSDYGSSGNGVWSHDGTGWTRITEWLPEGMAAVDGKLYGVFAQYDSGNGIWKNNAGTSWDRITDWIPDRIGTWGARLVAVFSNYGGSGNGLWIYENGSWRRATEWVPVQVHPWKGNTELAAVFNNYNNGNGLWSYDGSSWRKLSNRIPAALTHMGTADLATIFREGADSGVWKYTSADGSWQRVSDWVPQTIGASGDYVTGVFDIYNSDNGVWKYSGGSWTHMTDWIPREPKP